MSRRDIYAVCRLLLLKGRSAAARGCTKIGVRRWGTDVTRRSAEPDDARERQIEPESNVWSFGGGRVIVFVRCPRASVFGRVTRWRDTSTGLSSLFARIGSRTT